MSKKLKTKSWLPEFPGFYESHFSIDDYRIEEDIKEFIQDEEFKTLLLDNYYYSKESTRVKKNWENQVVKEFTNNIESLLVKENFVNAINFEELVKPKYYNFHSDSINCEYVFTKENISNIKQFIKDNFAAWENYLKENYTSRSGFISHHDNYPGSDEWIIEEALKDEHNCGSIMQFIIDTLDIDKDYLIQFTLENCYIDFDIENLINEISENENVSIPESVKKLINERKLDNYPDQLKLF